MGQKNIMDNRIVYCYEKLAKLIDIIPNLLNSSTHIR